MGTQPIFISTYRNEHQQFVPGYATRPRKLWTPGASGSRIHAVNIATNDSVANELQLYVGKKITDQADMGTGALADGGAGDDSITRTTGSFVTDGWRVGERLLLQGATTLANDFEAFLTTVAATTLGLPTGTVDTVENLPSGAELFRLLKLTYLAVPLGSGEPSVVAVSGLDITQMPALDASPDRFIMLGPNDVLFGAVTTLMGTDEVLDVVVSGGDY